MKFPARALAISFAVAIAGPVACGPGRGGPAAVGPVRWRWRPPAPASMGMPAADAASVVAEYGHWFLVLFGPRGDVRWRAQRLGFREEAPLLLSDLVVAPADDGLVAIERGSGRIVWDATFGEHAATPVRVGPLVVTSTTEGSLVGVEVATGRVAWRLALHGAAEGPPATDGRTVVATWEPDQGTEAGITAVDGESGALRWTRPLRAGGVSGPAVVTSPRGRAVAVAVDDDLEAKGFDLDTGERRWRVGLGGAGSPEVPPLALPGARVLVADRDAGLTMVGTDGRRHWHTRVGGAAERGAPVGPTAGGVFVVPLWSGRYLLAADGKRSRTVQPPGGVVNGVAVGPGGVLVVATAQGRDNQLVAYWSRPPG